MAIYALGNTEPVLPEAGSFWIAPTAQVIGRVRLGREVSIWFGAILRGDNEEIAIGAGSNIQDGCLLHTDRGIPLSVGESCTVGHHAILHGCMIGNNTLIGMGAQILNHARIGENSLVGAHALVTEGKEFPDRSLIVGAPARAIRALNEKEVEKLRESARHYVENGKRFSRELRRIDPPAVP